MALDILTLQRLGHENIVITDTYLHVNAKIQREMVEKLEFAIHQEEVNTYDVFIEGLKKTLLKQITNETYSSEQTETLKEIYDFINNKKGAVKKPNLLD